MRPFPPASDRRKPAGAFMSSEFDKVISSIRRLLAALERVRIHCRVDPAPGRWLGAARFSHARPGWWADQRPAKVYWVPCEPWESAAW